MLSFRHWAAVSALTPALALAQDAAPTARPTAEIYAQARATVEVPATIASIRVDVSSSGRTPAEAGARNAREAAALRRGLLALGLPEDSVVTRRVSAMQDVNYETKDTSFVATNSVSIVTRRLELLPRIIDTALVLGATDIADLSFSTDSLEERHLQALRQAIAKARRRAEVMADAEGGQLGRLLSSTTQESPGIAFRSPSTMLSSVTTGSRGGSRAAVPIQAPPVSISADVTVRWELAPKP